MNTFIKIYLIVSSIAVTGLAYVVNQTPYFFWDLELSKRIQTISYQPLIDVFSTLSNLGYGPTVDIWMAALIIFFFLFGKARIAISIMVGALIQAIFFFGITRLIHRVRPSPDLIHVVNKLTVNGFPSGHVILYTIIFGFLVYICINSSLPMLVKGLFTISCSLIIILIGLARIWSGEHWPSDVLGAYILGSIGLIITIFFYGWSNRFFKT